MLVKCCVCIEGSEIVLKNFFILSGWLKLGRIIYVIVVVCYDIVLDDCYYEFDVVVVNYQIVLVCYELYKRDIGKGKGKVKDEGISKENVVRVSDKLVKDFVDFIDLWELFFIILIIKFRYLIVGGFKNKDKGEF